MAALVLTPVTLVLNTVALVKLLRTPEAPAIPATPLLRAQGSTDAA